MDSKKYQPFIIIIGIFFIVKLSILFLAIDKLIYVEESYRAFIAKQLIDGPIMPFFDLQWDTYSGASLVVGLLMVPLFELLGQNIISLKLVALLVSFTTLILLYLFCYKFFNMRIAILASMLFILSPPVYTKYSLIVMSSHTESILFSILLMFAFFQIFINDKKNNFNFIILGLISGFGIWFTYIFSIMVFTSLLMWFLLDRIFFLRKNFLIFLISFTLGFSLWIYYNLGHSFIGINILGGHTQAPFFTTEHLIFSLEKLKNLLLNDFRNSLLFDDVISLSGKYLCTFYYIIFIVSFIFLVWSSRKFIYLIVQRFFSRKEISYELVPKEAFFLIYIVLFFLIYSFSNFIVNPVTGINGIRYLTPLYPIVFIVIAVFLNKMHEGKMWGITVFSKSLLIALLCIGVISNATLMSFNNIGANFFDINYSTSYNYLGFKIGNKYSCNIERCIRLINSMNLDDERYRYSLYKGLGFSIGRKFGNNTEKCVSLVNLLEEKYRSDVYRGIFRGFLWNSDIEKCISLINLIEEEYRFSLYRGLGFSIGNRFGDSMEKCISLLNLVERQYRACVCRGLGFSIGSKFGNNMEKCISLANLVEEQYRRHVYRGISLCRIWKSEIDKSMGLIDRVDKKYRPYFYTGLGKAFISAGYSKGKYVRLINCIEKAYKPYVYQGFGEGIGESKNWHFKGCVAHRISSAHWMEEEYKKFFYKGLGKGFYWQHIWFFGIDRDEAIIEREVTSKYKPYFYEGLDNPLGDISNM